MGILIVYDPFGAWDPAKSDPQDFLVASEKIHRAHCSGKTPSELPLNPENQKDTIFLEKRAVILRFSATLSRKNGLTDVFTLGKNRKNRCTGEDSGK